MPTFEFTSPDGQVHEVTGPEGATQEQAFAMLQQQQGVPAKKESWRHEFWNTLTDTPLKELLFRDDPTRTIPAGIEREAKESITQRVALEKGFTTPIEEAITKQTPSPQEIVKQFASHVKEHPGATVAEVLKSIPAAPSLLLPIFGSTALPLKASAILGKLTARFGTAGEAIARVGGVAAAKGLEGAAIGAGITGGKQFEIGKMDINELAANAVLGGSLTALMGTHARDIAPSAIKRIQAGENPTKVATDILDRFANRGEEVPNVSVEELSNAIDLKVNNSAIAAYKLMQKGASPKEVAHAIKFDPKIEQELTKLQERRLNAKEAFATDDRPSAPLPKTPEELGQVTPRTPEIVEAPTPATPEQLGQTATRIPEGPVDVPIEPKPLSAGGYGVGKKQKGEIDPKLLATIGAIGTGGAVGYALDKQEPIEGLLAGATAGFTIASLPRIINTFSNNWKKATTKSAMATTAVLGGAYLDKDHPVEGALIGAAVTLGKATLPKSIPIPGDDFLRARFGNIAAEDRIASVLSQQIKDSVPNLADREAISIQAEKGTTKGLSPAQVHVAQAYRNIMNDYATAAKDEGVMKGFIDNYVTHIVEKEGIPQSKADEIMAQLFGTEGAGASVKSRFGKERKYSTFQELETALQDTGLRIKTKDIAEILPIYMKSMTRAIENKKLINNLEKAELGLGKNANLLVKSDKDIPGYANMDHPQLRGYKVHPDLYSPLKFVFDSYKPGEMMKAAQGINMAVKRIGVSLSLFHAKSLAEAYGFASGDLNIKGAADAGIAAYKKAGLGDDVDLLMREGGLRVGAPHGDVNLQALTELGALIDERAGTKMFKSGGATLDAIQGRVDNFTWEYLHTGLKTNLALKLLEDYRRGETSLLGGKVKLEGMSEKEALQGIGSFVNDTLGGLDWYNVASEATTKLGQQMALETFNPKARAWLSLGVFAPDWTASTIRAFTKALPGGSNNKMNTILARNSQARAAITYFSAINAVNYALSGHTILENRDPTRIELKDGRSIQAFKHTTEFAHLIKNPMQFAFNKMAMGPRVAMAMPFNKEYPGGPDIESRAAYIGKQMSPFFAQPMLGESGMSTKSIGTSLMGAAGMPIYGKTAEERINDRMKKQMRKREDTLKRIRER